MSFAFAAWPRSLAITGVAIVIDIAPAVVEASIAKAGIARAGIAAGGCSWLQTVFSNLYDLFTVSDTIWCDCCSYCRGRASMLTSSLPI
jgi:hypothetical protein